MPSLWRFNPKLFRVILITAYVFAKGDTRSNLYNTKVYATSTLYSVYSQNVSKLHISADLTKKGPWGIKVIIM